MVFTFQLQAWSGGCVLCKQIFFFFWACDFCDVNHNWLCKVIHLIGFHKIYCSANKLPTMADKVLEIALLTELRDLSKLHKYLTCYLYKWSDLHLGHDKMIKQLDLHWREDLSHLLRSNMYNHMHYVYLCKLLLSYIFKKEIVFWLYTGCCCLFWSFNDAPSGKKKVILFSSFGAQSKLRWQWGWNKSTVALPYRDICIIFAYSLEEKARLF